MTACVLHSLLLVRATNARLKHIVGTGEMGAAVITKLLPSFQLELLDDVENEDRESIASLAAQVWV